jgi:hypothetical protein
MNITILFYIVISIFIYFIPTFLAIEKRNFTAIFFTNLLFGWTFIGWAIAFIWALMKDKD